MVYLSEKFKDSDERFILCPEKASFEIPNVNVTAERYRLLLRIAKNKVMSGTGKSTGNAEQVQLALRTITCTAGPDGFLSTLFDLGTISWLTVSSPDVAEVEEARLTDGVVPEFRTEQAH